MVDEVSSWPSRRKSVHVTFRLKPEIYDAVIQNNPENLSKSLNDLLKKAITFSEEIEDQ